MFATRAYTSILSVIFFLVILVAASPAPAPWGGGVPTKTITVTATPVPTGGSGSGNCNTGPIQCCQQVQKANAGGPLTDLLNLLEIAISPLDALVGAECSPLSIIGVGQATCSATPVCCQNNNVGGLISIGCIAVIL